MAKSSAAASQPKPLTAKSFRDAKIDGIESKQDVATFKRAWESATGQPLTDARQVTRFFGVDDADMKRASVHTEFGKAVVRVSGAQWAMTRELKPGVEARGFLHGP